MVGWVFGLGFMGAMVVEAHKAACSRPAWSQKKTLPDGGSGSRSPGLVTFDRPGVGTNHVP